MSLTLAVSPSPMPPVLPDRTEPHDEPPYAEWCRRIRRGDSRAFELLFRDLHPGLVRFAGTLAESAAASDDLVQEAFVRLWERRDRLDPARSVRALLYQTVRNLGLNRVRDRSTRQDKLNGLAADAPAPIVLPDAHAEAADTGDRLRAWVADLPDRQREALRLTRFEGLSHDEAAEVMGVSPRTVNNHLVRALRTLRDRLHRLDPPTA
ncbi:MAG: sigma-70 family RNA polymerase sigma factor [Bacteroidota bacterium]